VIVSVLLELSRASSQEWSLERTRVVAGKNLGEEQAQGDPRVVDPVAPEMVAATAGGLDG
jgi:hypothetical protein